MSHTRNASLRFAMSLTLWAIFAVAALSYAVYIVTRLSFAFFAANGMISHAEIIEALYIRVFDIDPVFFFMLVLGLSGVAISAFIFSNSQFNYFRRLVDVIVDFSYSGTIPPQVSQVGPFSKPLQSFLEAASRRMEKKGDESVREVLSASEKDWPTAPALSWKDQAQFAIVATMIAIFFSTLAIIFFWKVSDRIIELSGNLIRYKVASGPLFFNSQTDIVGLVMWTVFGLMIVAFMFTGFHFGRNVSEAAYAIMRDLKKFTFGDLSHRVLLRGNDPAAHLMPQLNDALNRIAEKIKS